MFGQIEIEITLAPAGVLMLGAVTTTTAFAGITGSQIGTNIPAAGSLTGTALSAEGASYKLTDL